MSTAEHHIPRPEVPGYLSEHYGFKIAYSTLEKMAVNGGGPAFRTFRRRAYYAIADLESWVNQHLSSSRRSTSSQEARQ